MSNFFGGILDIFSAFEFISFLSVIIITIVVCLYIQVVERAETVRLTGNVIFVTLMCFIIGLLGVRTTATVFGAVFGGVVLVIIVLFTPRVEGVLRRVNGNATQGGFGAVIRPNITIRLTNVRSYVRSAVRTYSSLDSAHANTLVIFRGRALLNGIVSDNALLGTGPSGTLVGGIFCPGAPLRSNTVIVEGNGVLTTNYVLPLAGGRLGAHFNAHRHTTINLARRDSTVMIIISRRANSVSITEGNILADSVSSNRLESVLVDAFVPDNSSSSSGVVAHLMEEVGGW